MSEAVLIPAAEARELGLALLRAADIAEEKTP